MEEVTTGWALSVSKRLACGAKEHSGQENSLGKSQKVWLRERPKRLAGLEILFPKFQNLSITFMTFATFTHLHNVSINIFNLNVSSKANLIL